MGTHGANRDGIAAIPGKNGRSEENNDTIQW